MQRSTHTFRMILLTGLAVLGTTSAENKPSIASEFLSVLAKNVATVLSPTLVGELHDGRPNRTAVNATIAFPVSTRTESAEESEATTEPTKSSSLEADTVRSAQTQSEVRPGNGNFPFNFEESNYRYNYPGLNGQGLAARPEAYPSGPFAGSPGGPGYFNPDFYRGFPGQTSPEPGNSQRGESVGGVSPVETIGDGQPGRSPDSLEPSASPERFRSFDRFPFGSQYLGGFPNFPGPSFSSQRQEGRFGQPLADGFAPSLRANPNFANNPSYQNLVAGNYPRNGFQPSGDSFGPRQQGFRSNNFDFSGQRFQSPFDGFPRSLQRGPNFPLFHPAAPFLAEVGDSENLVPSVPSTDRPAKSRGEASTSRISPKADLLKDATVVNSTAAPVTSKPPEILSVQGRVRFGRLLLPSLDDYDDLRFRPDDFREYLFSAEDKNNTDTPSTTGQSTANDV